MAPRSPRPPRSPHKFDPNQPVPVVLAPNDFEAQVIAHALNAEGIKAMVAGTHVQMFAGPGNPLAPVSVIVRRGERMEAISVLRRLRAEAKGLPVPDGVPIHGVTESGACVVCGYDMTGLETTIVCPECGTNLAHEETVFEARQSGSVMQSRALRILIILLLIAGVVAAFYESLERLHWGWGY